MPFCAPGFLPIGAGPRLVHKAPHTIDVDAFQVLPSILKWVPMMAPSASESTSATLSILTPVLANTGTLVIASRTLRRSDWSAGGPVIGPETRIASARDENTALVTHNSSARARSVWANSALMANRSFISERPNVGRNHAAPAQSGCQSPMSDANSPVRFFARSFHW